MLRARASTTCGIATDGRGTSTNTDGVFVDEEDVVVPPSGDGKGGSGDAAAEEEYLTRRFAEIANRGISLGADDAIDDDDDDVDEDGRDDGDDEEDGGGAPHDYGILIVHYHKTGYVLSRLLTKLVTDLEHRAGGKDPPPTSMRLRAADYVDGTTGLRIAFGTRGHWNSNFVPARRHGGVTGCPMTLELAAGVIHLQESPDLFCGDAHLSRLMLGASAMMGGGGGGGGGGDIDGGAEEGGEEEEAASATKNGVKIKIVHFVRNPFEMASSNYFYHAQDPTVSEPYFRDVKRKRVFFYRSH